ncbi:MAG: hypothetical protein ACYC9S_10160 [Leptospirales bacterium]
MVFKKEDILNAFEEIGGLAKERGIVVDIGVYGGSAIALQWEFRQSTRDVDVVVFGDPQFLREAASVVAARHGWPENWINDAVKGFVSARQDIQLYIEFPREAENPGLRVFTPKPEYMLAMKCMAMRTGSEENRSDIDDIKNLVRITGVKSTQDILSIVEKYYPAKLVTPRTLFGIQEILESMNKERKHPGFEMGR